MGAESCRPVILVVSVEQLENLGRQRRGKEAGERGELQVQSPRGVGGLEGWGLGCELGRCGLHLNAVYI